MRQENAADHGSPPHDVGMGAAELYREVYNIFNQAEMAPMYPATAQWREKLTGIVGKLVNDYGLDGVYIDQKWRPVITRERLENPL